jgi:uncharacterized YccA/Bax inhibitor family protein
MFELMNTLKAGQQLKDPTTWKNRQLTLNAVTILLAALIAVLRVTGVDVMLSDEALQLLAEIIAAILGFINILLTTATTKKVGL